ncbi:MAG: hypothetical protein WD801_07040 [Gemmatimonadaceae bacterium]
MSHTSDHLATSPVSRRARAFDLLSMTLVVTGTAAYLWAFAGMRTLRDAPHDPSAAIYAGYVRYVRLTQLSWVALGTICIGVVVGIGAALYHRRGRSMPPSS